MGLEFWIDGRRLVLRTSGHLDLPQLRAAFEEIREEMPPKVKEVLIEDTGSDFVPDEATREALVDTMADAFGDRQVRIALVVARQVHLGLGRILDVLGETRGLKFRAFSDRSLAEAWLSGEGPEAEPGF